MNAWMPLGLRKPEPMDSFYFYPTQYVKKQAIKANLAFDESVKQYLRHWIEQGTVASDGLSLAGEHDIDEFVEYGALRCFFKHHDNALERLLQQDDIANHLLRPSTEVYFEPDAYEPLLARFERRIYNLAAQREHLEVPFRYSPVSRQSDYGDSVGLADMPAGAVREDIGLYFGTRRSDTTALNLLARQLRREALFSTALPIHVVTEGYMEDSLRIVRQMTEQLREDGDQMLHCFVIQRRHAFDDRHLGAALLLMNPQQPDLPQRVIFCDTLKPNGKPPWWNKFKRYVDTVFPQPADSPPASDRLEDGGLNLQRLHDGVPVRHQDIDCAFYTVSMVNALIQIAKLSPELLVSSSIEEVVRQMTARIPEYFEGASTPKAPEHVREVNVVRRWQTGQEALIDIRRSYQSELALPVVTSTKSDGLNWVSIDQAVSGIDLSAA
ncbi:hypothetical protein SAMN05216167_11843 [Spirosoma endophyticum]|uniref:Uncharacterized protein n=2 Tax=Spirosoma endophyticum TaxID=662367 RepID=A0A1I2CST2_9BACT|nr:hypothetical protein SAMN05216167_11843 [Spirosoma endophyticum]